MYKILTILAIQLLPEIINAQHKFDFNWVIGYGTNLSNHGGATKIDFTSGEPDLTHFAFPYHFALGMPCSISDEAGNLQFYSNGCKIVNYENEIIENGEDLSPGYFHDILCDEAPYYYDAYQNMTILPRPEHPGRYVYFHPTKEMNISGGKILYSEVDMNANNGKGKVIDKNHLLREPVDGEGAFISVKHANGRDWWIVIPEQNQNVYNSYLLTPDSILGPFTQNWQDSTASLYPNASWNVFISPDGKTFGRVTLTWVDAVNRFNRIFLYDFDRCTGTLSNSRVIKVDDPAVYASWVQISPNSRFMYFQIAQDKLFQYDLQAPNIEASAQLIAEYDGFVSPLGFSCAFHAMAQAPNNKIYMCTTSGIYYYHTIHSPDKRGLACDFRQHDLELPSVSNNLMPNFPNFRLGPVDGSACDTLGMDNRPVANFRWEAVDTLNPQQIEFTDLSYFEPATWSWDFGDGTVSQDTSPVHEFSGPGIYTVCLKVCNANDCNSLCQDVNIQAVNTKNIEGTSAVLWPNPVDEVLNLKAMDKIEAVMVYNAIGQRMTQVKISTIESQTLLDVQSLVPGIYYISFLENRKIKTGSFIKK